MYENNLRKTPNCELEGKTDRKIEHNIIKHTAMLLSNVKKTKTASKRFNMKSLVKGKVFILLKAKLKAVACFVHSPWTKLSIPRCCQEMVLLELK